jgi:hypothetical protein
MVVQQLRRRGPVVVLIAGGSEHTLAELTVIPLPKPLSSPLVARDVPPKTSHGRRSIMINSSS